MNRRKKNPLINYIEHKRQTVTFFFFVFFLLFFCNENTLGGGKKCAQVQKKTWEENDRKPLKCRNLNVGTMDEMNDKKTKRKKKEKVK